jgi:hypothetical protein
MRGALAPLDMLLIAALALLTIAWFVTDTIFKQIGIEVGACLVVLLYIALQLRLTRRSV